MRDGGTDGRPMAKRKPHAMPVLRKRREKHPPNPLPTLIPQQSDDQQITAEQIPHRQGFHPLTILSAKPTLEIHGPHVIASASLGQSASTQLRPSGRTPARPTRQLHSLQPLAHRSRRRSTLTRIFLAQPSCQFPAAPTPMSSAQPSNPNQPLGWSLPWRLVWTAR